MRGTAACVCLVALLMPSSLMAAPQWTALFNGKNLDNFDIAYSSKPVDARPASAMFEVKDGVVHTYPGQTAGSTARITSGSVTMARAIATLCSCPPESWRGV